MAPPQTFELADPETPDSETPTVDRFHVGSAASSNGDGSEDSAPEEAGSGTDDGSVSSGSADTEDGYENEAPGETETASSGHEQPLLQRSHSSLLMANAFAPPFYNRPPTPLPPSPSLTTLLRPPFSTTTSRPTTPDSSENETPNETESAVTKSATIASAVPRASPKVPTYEYYGFVLYLLSSLAFLMYLLWSYLPSPFLHQLGIHYYPNRWWSLAIPSFLVMGIVYIYVALASYNTGYLTLPMESIENMVDDAAQVAVLGPHGKIVRKKDSTNDARQGHTATLNSATGVFNIHNKTDWTTAWSEGTDAVMDVPVGGVCEVLYG